MTCRIEWYSAMVALLLLVGGCGSETNTEPDATPTAADLTAEAWRLFESEEYDAALARFGRAIELDDAHAEAIQGHGWTQLRLDSLSEAIQDFDRAILAGDSTADPLAGKSIGHRDLDPARFDLTIANAEEALELEPRYAFSHDSRFDWRDLRLLLAQAHFALGHYELANVQIDSLGGQVHDPKSETFVESLLVEIQRLGAEFTP